MIRKPQPSELPGYYVYYIDLIPENNLQDALTKSHERTLELFSSVPVEKESYAYAPEKWTIKQLLNHIIDSERIFAYRALRFSRYDTTELPGYDEDLYAQHSNTGNLMLERLIEEYSCVRKSTLSLFETMSEQMLDFRGKANRMEVSTRGLGFMIAGHNLHHCKILKERYL